MEISWIKRFPVIFFREIRWQAEMVRFQLKQINLVQKEDKEKGEKTMKKNNFTVTMSIVVLTMLMPAVALANTHYGYFYGTERLM